MKYKAIFNRKIIENIEADGYEKAFEKAKKKIKLKPEEIKSIVVLRQDDFNLIDQFIEKEM